MVLQKEHRFSVNEYYRMAETGVLPPESRVELLEGRIIDMSPIGPWHGGVVKILNKFFVLRAKGRWIVSTKDPLRLNDYSEPQPDLMLLKRRNDSYTSSHPQPHEVFVLIEVSDTTIVYDRTKKLSAYASAGVPEVWIANLEEETLELYREPSFTGYVTQTILRPGDQASPQSFPDTSLEVADLFRRPKI